MYILDEKYVEPWELTSRKNFEEWRSEVVIKRDMAIPQPKQLVLHEIDEATEQAEKEINRRKQLIEQLKFFGGNPTEEMTAALEKLEHEKGLLSELQKENVDRRKKNSATAKEYDNAVAVWFIQSYPHLINTPYINTGAFSRKTNLHYSFLEPDFLENEVRDYYRDTDVIPNIIRSEYPDIFQPPKLIVVTDLDLRNKADVDGGHSVNKTLFIYGAAITVTSEGFDTTIRISEPGSAMEYSYIPDKIINLTLNGRHLQELVGILRLCLTLRVSD